MQHGFINAGNVALDQKCFFFFFTKKRCFDAQNIFTVHTVVTKSKRNNLRLRSFFEIVVSL